MSANPQYRTYKMHTVELLSSEHAGTAHEKVQQALEAVGIEVALDPEYSPRPYLTLWVCAKERIRVAVERATSYSPLMGELSIERVLENIGRSQGSISFLRLLFLTEILGGGKPGAMKTLGFVVAHDLMPKLDEATMEPGESPGEKYRKLGSFDSLEDVMRNVDCAGDMGYVVDSSDPHVASKEQARLARDYEMARRRYNFEIEGKDPLENELEGCRLLAEQYEIPFDPEVLRCITQEVIEHHTKWDMSGPC